MLNERLAAARLVREALTAVEVDLEQSLVNANKLSITLLKARANCQSLREAMLSRRSRRRSATSTQHMTRWSMHMASLLWCVTI